MNKPIGYLPSIQKSVSSRSIMWQVIAATLPAFAVIIYEQGTRIIFMMLVGIIAAISCESLILFMRKKDNICQKITDGSAILTAILLVFSLPILAPTWLIISGVAFAIIFGKQLYGGVGMNLFNPAMVGYCFLLISFPTVMSQQSHLSYGFQSFFQHIDATSAATILDSSRQSRILNQAVSNHDWNQYQPYINAIAWSIGGAYLLFKRFISWRIVTACLLGILATAAIFYRINNEQYLDPMTQLFAGASIFGALFIATDPVTAATSNKGKWIFGFMIGGITICVRNLGNFPDGFAFAVLLANACVPLLDRYTQPRY